MTPTLIYCADGNSRFAQIAIDCGFLYGAQLPKTVYFPPQFVDQNWKNPVREPYMKALNQYRPQLATVLDWEREEQLDEVLSWAHESARYADNVIIIPKVMGGIQRLPRTVNGKPVRLGYSVPTTFSGTQLPIWEFCGWPIHLLGGSPRNQMTVAKYLNVQSADGNYLQRIAREWGKFFFDNQYIHLKELAYPHIFRGDHKSLPSIPDGMYKAFRLSCINVRAVWERRNFGIRYATPADVDAIKTIGNRYKNELGFVNRAALLEGIKRLEVFVATYNKTIAGFAHWHARRDGQSTLYEIGVWPEYERQGIGAALLRAIPRPVKLKCTQDNPANGFYERQGLTLTGTEPGRKRKLNVWVYAR